VLGVSEQPPHYTPEAPPTVAVFLTVGTRTSQGAGPGFKHLPPLEAAAHVNAKHAVYGTRPPDGYAGSAEPARAGIFPPEQEQLWHWPGTC
jgi:hypothetical protein